MPAGLLEGRRRAAERSLWSTERVHDVIASLSNLRMAGVIGKNASLTG
ncbi:MAG: hypothetical protein WD490_03885 [Opitutales bacterium]